jgi:acetyl-CoA carboxylase carboxyltransferase component
VFGDCIAGGGYMPIISDRVYMTESAYMVIAGAALIKGAKSQKLTSLDIGGPEVHVHQSACADVRVPDDDTALRLIRAEIARLPSSAADFYRHGAAAAPPLHPPSEIAAVLPDDHRQVYEMREVLARLVDDSLFCEVMGDRGPEMITGVARVNGLWCGFIANNLLPTAHPDHPGRMRAGGILYRDGIAKISAFSRACNEDGIPIVWLQDIAGFDIGVEAEAQGLLGYGSSLIYTNSTNTVPMVTVLLRKASGAGYYAMAGMPYDPVLQLSTPLTRLAVMEGRTLAIAAFNTKLDDDFEIATKDPAERAAIEKQMADTAARIEADMDPMAAAARMDTDEVVAFADLRAYLEAAVEMAWQSPRRARNPRIWSLHDLEALSRGSVVRTATDTAVRVATQDTAPVEGLVPVRVGTDGTFWRRPSPRDAWYAEPGARVDATTAIGLIEVMKTFAPVRAPVAGVLDRFAVADGAAVEAGAVVAWVRPDP